jgi:hypothetical protein
VRLAAAALREKAHILPEIDTDGRKGPLKEKAMAGSAPLTTILVENAAGPVFKTSTPAPKSG